MDIDCEKGDGPKLAERYGIRGYPTYIMVNPDGEVTDSWIGYPGPVKWAAFVEAGDKDRRTIAQKTAAYEAEPTLALARSLANHASTSSKYRESVAYFNEARELDPDNAGEYTQEILYGLYYGSGDKVFSAEEIKTEADRALNDENSTAADKIDLAGLITEAARNIEDPRLAVPYIEAALEASEGNQDQEIAAGRVDLEIALVLIAERDKEKALRLKRASLDEGWQDDPRAVNRFAYWCYENDVNLVEAEELVTRGIEAAADDAMRNRFLNTAAEICNATGRPDEAVTHIKRILETDPDRGYYQRQLARFEQIAREKADR